MGNSILGENKRQDERKYVCDISNNSFLLTKKSDTGMIRALVF
jgi:hypothetical protein